MDEETKTASAMVREEANDKNRSRENINLRASQQATANANWGKGLAPEQRAALEHLAREIGLSTPMGHLIYLGGQPYITAKGHLALAHKQGMAFQGFDEEPVAKSDYEHWGIPEDAAYAWLCRVWRMGIERPFVEVGHAGGKRDANQPVARAHPAEMARKRARCRALDLAFPAPIPSYEDAALGGVAIPDEIWAKVQQKVERGMSFYEIENAVRPFGINKAGIAQRFGEVTGGGDPLHATREQGETFVAWAKSESDRAAMARVEMETTEQEAQADEFFE